MKTIPAILYLESCNDDVLRRDARRTDLALQKGMTRDDRPTALTTTLAGSQMMAQRQ